MQFLRLIWLKIQENVVPLRYAKVVANLHEDGRGSQLSKRLNFTEKRGMMAVYLTDGREVIVPVSMFKDISAMPVTTAKICISE